MIRSSILVSAAALICTVPATAFAQVVIDYRTNGPAVGTTLVFKSSRGNTYTMTMESKTTFKSNTGSTAIKNSDGNSLRSGSRVFSPHSGYRPSNSGGALKVGQSWAHTYSVNGVRRIRRCRVERKGQYVNSTVTVLGAFKVKCTNRRLDRQYPMNEEIWFTPNLFTELDYRATWGSSGGFSFQLIGVR